MTSPGTRSDCPDRAALERAAAGGESELRPHLDECPDCAKEVRRIRHDNALIADFLAANADTFEATTVAMPVIEGYELIGELHRGAQGVVYRAVQTATKRTVAVKTLTRGAFATMRQRRRFEREVELVATLRHPNVVTVFDSGRTADGGHFLTMEYVDGIRLDWHVKGVGGNVRDRLRLFAEICEGVSAAHQRGIIHRDLKPANILVDAQGVPRILDFGLAKRADDGGEAEMMATVEGEFLGTFAYAAPEQLRGAPSEIDVRSDVYTLGVILYEMLVGSRPYPLSGGVTEVARTIIETPPSPPSQMRRGVDDEVETITLKALAKDPARRYQSAGALLEDVRHYLAGAPINAKRDSRWYLARKTISRYRVAVAVIAAFFALSLWYGVATTLAHKRTTAAREKETEMLVTLLELVGSASLQSRINESTIPQLFDEVDRVLSGRLADRPAVVAAIREEIGLARLERGEFEEASLQLGAVVDLQRQRHSGDHPELADALHNEARALWYLGRIVLAEQRYREALAMRRAVYGTRHELVATTMSHLGATLRRQGKYEEAESLYRGALEIRQTLHEPGDKRITRSFNSLGVCLRDQRRFAEALSLFEEQLDIMGPRAPGNEEGEAALLHNAGICLIELERLDEATARINEALAIKRSHLEDTHTRVAATELAQARIALEKGEVAEAEVICRRALASQEAEYDADHIEIADSLFVLSRILLAQDRAAEAKPPLTRALAIRKARLPEGHWKIAEARELLADG